MNIEDLTIGQARELAGIFQAPIVQNKNCSIMDNILGEVCVVRTYSAGVHIGRVISIDGTSCELEGSQRLFTWKGAFTLSEVANKGVSKESRMSMKTVIFLTQAIEFIPCSEQAIESFKNTKQE